MSTFSSQLSVISRKSLIQREADRLLQNIRAKRVIKESLKRVVLPGLREELLDILSDLDAESEKIRGY